VTRRRLKPANYSAFFIAAMACITLLGCFATTVPAQESRLPTADEIPRPPGQVPGRARSVLKLGSAKTIRAHPVRQGRGDRQAGEAALASGRLLQAHEAFRQAPLAVAL